LKTDDDGAVFNATGERLNLPGDYSSFVFDSNFTILLWVRPNTIPDATFLPVMEKVNNDQTISIAISVNNTSYKFDIEFPN